MIVTVHPRMGGEQLKPLLNAAEKAGSSPHGRGTVQPGWLIACELRFIPAWAGNREVTVRQSRTNPVHPRMGGEQNVDEFYAFFPSGSSPHGRGTDRSKYAGIVHYRFIPAWAGNRTSPS